MPEPDKTCRILLTAFDGYQDGERRWVENASKLAVEHLLRVATPQLFAQGIVLTTQVYPVEFRRIRASVLHDLAAGYDAMILTGQAPGSSAVRLEMVGKNLGCDPLRSDSPFPLEMKGPSIVTSTIHWREIMDQISSEAAQVRLSEDAGDYLCNAALYYAVLLTQQNAIASLEKVPTRVGFVHVPLAPNQLGPGYRGVSEIDDEYTAASLPTLETAAILEKIILAVVRQIRQGS